MSLFLFIGWIATSMTANLPVPPPLPRCPIGTVAQLTEHTSPVGESFRRDGLLIYRHTTLLRAKSKSCAIVIKGFSPNTRAARLEGGTYFYARNDDGLATLAGSGRYLIDGSTYYPAHTIDTKQRCDPKAVDSVVFGPYGSCAALYRNHSGSWLLVSTKSGDLTQIPLPENRYYIAIDAGSWAHDIGGELALVRSESGESSIDIFTLYKS